MNDRPLDPAPPSADETACIFPDLARIMLREGRVVDAGRAMDGQALSEALRATGHRPAAVAAAIENCARSPDPDNEVVVDVATLAEWIGIAVALSGGGFRATVYEMGILLYLASADELKHVTGVVSVSGGSILAAHLALRWKAASTDTAGFVEVCAELLKFTQMNIRDRAIEKWIWSRVLLFTWFWPGWGRTYFLEQEYRRHFGEATLEELPSGADAPKFAFVATDTKRGQRVALTPSGILRFAVDGRVTGDPIFAKATHLALAVAASSCFPPVFHRLKLNYNSLGVLYDEFDGKLLLRDGGVAGNLGVEVLTYLLKRKDIRALRVLACDAETGLATEPLDTPLAVINVQGQFLSESARQIVAQLGPNAITLSFKSRPEQPYGLAARIQTKLAGYRTDLDRPTWSESYALLLHGAAVAANSLSGRLPRSPSADEVHQTIKRLLIAAGCPADLPKPTEAALKGCGRRSYWRVLGSFFAAGAVAFLLWGGLSEVISLADSRWNVRPLRAAWRLFAAEPIVDRNPDALSQEVAAAICENKLVDVQKTYVDGGLSRFLVTVGEDASGSMIYSRKTIRPPGCDRDLVCEFVFRGKFETGRPAAGGTVTVIGRITEIRTNDDRRNGYVTLSDCYIPPPSARRTGHDTTGK